LIRATKVMIFNEKGGGCPPSSMRIKALVTA
jgi:hypothetical protein